jgi:hypothetical protein
LKNADNKKLNLIKMYLKIYFFLFVILTGFLSCGTKNKSNIHILKPGVGVDDFVLGKITLEDITNCYGNKYSIDAFYFRPPLKRKIYSIKVAYDTIGISFSFGPDMKSVFCISVQAPFNGKTEKGITAGKSTFQDVEKAYGESSWSYLSDDLPKIQGIIKSYDGIQFFATVNETMLIADSVLIKYQDKVVAEIDIVAKKANKK